MRRLAKFLYVGGLSAAGVGLNVAAWAMILGADHLVTPTLGCVVSTWTVGVFGLAMGGYE